MNINILRFLQPISDNPQYLCVRFVSVIEARGINKYDGATILRVDIPNSSYIWRAGLQLVANSSPLLPGGHVDELFIWSSWEQR